MAEKMTVEKLKEMAGGDPVIAVIQSAMACALKGTFLNDDIQSLITSELETAQELFDSQEGEEKAPIEALQKQLMYATVLKFLEAGKNLASFRRDWLVPMSGLDLTLQGEVLTGGVNGLIIVMQSDLLKCIQAYIDKVGELGIMHPNEVAVFQTTVNAMQGMVDQMMAAQR